MSNPDIPRRKWERVEEQDRLEIERLRAEVERLKAELAQALDDGAMAEIYKDKWRAVAERLGAAIADYEALKGELK